MNTDSLVLLVDDDENHLLLMEAAFEQAQFGCALKTLTDAQQAIDYMQRAASGNGSKEALPSLLFLDLKMPGKTGFDVLAWVRSQRHLMHLPVMVLSSSREPRDIDLAFELDASAYLVKPLAYDELVRMLQCVQEWLQMNHFAPGNTSPRMCWPRSSRV